MGSGRRCGPSSKPPRPRVRPRSWRQRSWLSAASTARSRGSSTADRKGKTTTSAVIPAEHGAAYKLHVLLRRRLLLKAGGFEGLVPGGEGLQPGDDSFERVDPRCIGLDGAAALTAPTLKPAQGEYLIADEKGGAAA